jgi:hypothetical protein
LSLDRPAVVELWVVEPLLAGLLLDGLAAALEGQLPPLAEAGDPPVELPPPATGVSLPESLETASQIAPRPPTTARPRRTVRFNRPLRGLRATPHPSPGRTARRPRLTSNFTTAVYARGEKV